MAIGIPHIGLLIYTSPKVFSTSLKYLAFSLENEREFVPFVAEGKIYHIHHFYPARPFTPPDRERYPHVVAFVRDPLARLLSAYGNRVLVRRKQSEKDWRRAVSKGLSAQPTFSQFVSSLQRYRDGIPEIHHHTAPQVEFLGRDLGVYDRVFGAHNLMEFESFVGELAGKSIYFPHEQRSPRPNGLSVKAQIRNLVRSFYSADYDALRDDLPPESSQLGHSRGSQLFRRS